MVYRGGCACGDIRYEVQGEVVDASYCHCSVCRRVAGAPVVAWVTFPLAAFRYRQGAPAVWQSSERARREHCPRCGSALVFRLTDEDSVDVTIASLDQPESIRPEFHIWVENRLPWFETTDSLPRHWRGEPSD